MGLTADKSNTRQRPNALDTHGIKPNGEAAEETHELSDAKKVEILKLHRQFIAVDAQRTQLASAVDGLCRQTLNEMGLGPQWVVDLENLSIRKQEAVKT